MSAKGRKFPGGEPRDKARRRVVLLEDISVLGQWEDREEDTNESFLEELLRAVRCAVQNELTDCQRRCFTLYFEEGLTVRQIARRLNVNDSTASRHLAAAKNKVRRYARYCAFGSAPGGRAGEKRFFSGR